MESMKPIIEKAPCETKHTYVQFNEVKSHRYNNETGLTRYRMIRFYFCSTCLKREKSITIIHSDQKPAWY